MTRADHLAKADQFDRDFLRYAGEVHTPDRATDWVASSRTAAAESAVIAAHYRDMAERMDDA